MSHAPSHPLDQNQTDIIAALAAATTKALAEARTPKRASFSSEHTDEEPVSSDSADMDLENEPIAKKRERQRSLVLNLGKKYHAWTTLTKAYFHEKDQKVLV